MNRENILTSRKGALAQLMCDRNLAGALVCLASREGLDSWLLDKKECPVLPPFGRLSLFLIGSTGEVTARSAYAGHPCDFPHYPLFDGEDVRALIQNHRLGIVNPEKLLKLTLEQLKAVDPAIELVDITPEVLELKAQKTPEERELLRKNAVFMDRLFGMVPWLLRPGETELEAAVSLRRTLDDFGLKNTGMEEDTLASSDLMLTSSPQDAPCGEVLDWPGRRLQTGDRVNLALRSYLHGGFSGALGRCYTIGEATEQTRRWWELTCRVQDMLADALRPGDTIAQAVERVNRELTEPAGLVPLGADCVHGIGVSRSEAPRYADASREMQLKAGMMLVIAPRIAPPGQDPYCCMDVFELTTDGAARLGKTTRELREIGLFCG